MRPFRGRKPRPKVGNFYWDCNYHPVLATEVDGDDIAGISLFDGTQPRSCSMLYCGIDWLTYQQVVVLLERKAQFMLAEKVFTACPAAATDPYRLVLNSLPVDLFPRKNR